MKITPEKLAEVVSHKRSVRALERALARANLDLQEIFTEACESVGADPDSSQIALDGEVSPKVQP